MSMMKEASIGRVKDYIVNWKTVRVKEKEEHTKIVPARESYTYRKFTVKKSK
jgi:predicted phage-related endonuclease